MARADSTSMDIARNRWKHDERKKYGHAEDRPAKSRTGYPGPMPGGAAMRPSGFFPAAGLTLLLCAGVALGQTCQDFSETEFSKTPLATSLDSPMKMAIAKDGRIFFIERSGAVRILKPGSGTPVQAHKFAVAGGSNNEDGVLGIALDPGFESNNRIYVFHTLANPMGYRLSRFTLTGDILDPASEKIVLRIPHVFTAYGSLIIHGAGAIAFDPSGNLLISLGDLSITNGGFPVPVLENNTSFDAQRTSANTNSMLGKILRITPKDDGTYDIPAGNLFPAGTPNTLPEIYAMGVRNPFTLTIDPLTGWAYSGEVGPDGVDGPIASQDEINQIRQAGNFGWPYVTGDNQAYSSPAGAKYDPANLVNNSKNSTGAKTLPPAVKSLFWFSNRGSWPLAGITPKGGNRCIKVGGFYRFNPQGLNPKRLPPSMDNGFFMANHNDAEPLRFFKLDAAGNLVSMKPVLTNLARPMSAEIGPDGQMYLIEWGSDNGHWFNGKNGVLSRIDYTGKCSTTGLIGAGPDRRGIRNGRKDMLLALAPGMRIRFPDWASRADVHDMNGARVASLPRAEGAQTPLPMEFRSGLRYVRFLEE
jgi:cytochrome c